MKIFEKLKKVFSTKLIFVAETFAFIYLAVYLKNTDPFAAGVCLGFSLIPVLVAGD